MFVPIVSGLDKTTVSVATGHQQYHPFYFSAGNLTNTARRAHGNGVIPIAFLPIPNGEQYFGHPAHSAAESLSNSQQDTEEEEGIPDICTNLRTASKR